MKRILLLLFFSFTGLAYMQTNGASNNNDQSSTPSDFPVLNNTGNPTQDALNYDLAKKEWIKNNPGKYAAMNGTTIPFSERSTSTTTDLNSENNKHRISKTEFDAMPTERRQYIIENPTLYIVTDDANLLNGSNLNSQNSNTKEGKQKISKIEFQNMPFDRQTHISAHPELYEIVD
jgi:hypothetical protein